MTLPVFSVRNVSRHYDVEARTVRAWRRKRTLIRAVDGVSLDVRKDEVLGIIGESGSGKSTLGFMLAGIERMTGGDILFHGRSLGALPGADWKAFRQRVQVVFQDSGSALNPRRRVLKVLCDSLRLKGMPKPLRAELAHELLQKVGLSKEHGQRFPHELSGGQRQRVGIARALAMEPEVLIADEPVSALDVSLQGQIVNLLLDLRSQYQLTIVFISHDIAVINHICGRVAVMHNGRLTEVGSTSDVIRRPQAEYTKRLISAVPKGLAGRRATTAWGETRETGIHAFSVDTPDAPLEKSHE